MTGSSTDANVTVPYHNRAGIRVSVYSAHVVGSEHIGDSVGDGFREGAVVLVEWLWVLVGFQHIVLVGRVAPCFFSVDRSFRLFSVAVRRVDFQL